MTRFLGGPAFDGQFNDLNMAAWLREPATAPTRTAFTIGPNTDFEVQYVGTGFAYDRNGNATGGTVTSISIVSVGVSLLVLSDLRLPVTTLRTFTQSDDTPGFLSRILGGNDVITGTSAIVDGFLSGFTGNDSIRGGVGFDTLDGGAGNDTLDGGVGDDVLIGGAGNDVYIADSADDLVVGEVAGRTGGVDTVVSSAQEYTMGDDNVENLILDLGAERGVGNGLNNRILGNEAGNRLEGSVGNDTLSGGGGNDTLVADDAGRDLLIGGSGDDRYVVGDGDRIMESVAGAGGGNDFVVYTGTRSFTLGNHLERLDLADGSDAVEGTGNSLANAITGNGNSNRLRGMAGDDLLVGSAGSNTLDGGVGADSMVGGNDRDFFIVDNASDVIDESAGITDLSFDFVQSSISFDLTENGTTVIGRLESLELTGSKAINGTGNDFRNEIRGNSAANILNGGGGNDDLFGGGGNDSLIGGGDVGVDDLDGGLGADTMDGGAGNDVYNVDSIWDVVIERDGLAGGSDGVRAYISYTLPGGTEDLFLDGTAINGTGNASSNVIFGNTSHNRLRGLDGQDSLAGNSGNDTLDGGTGDDTLIGGAGNDTYLVDELDDVVDETSFGGGIDSVFATATYTLSTDAAANVENLTLVGAGNIDGRGNGLGNRIIGNEGRNDLSGLLGNDTISGGNGDDRLVGGDGNDNLSGGNGVDNLIGGGGDDTLNGGAGNDFYAYQTGLDGHDLIVGFDGNAVGGQDTLDLNALFDLLRVASADRAGRILITDRGGAVDIRVDTDGDRAFDLFAATLQTPDAITIGADIVTGTLEV